jgi:hypothetical protein
VAFNTINKTYFGVKQYSIQDEYTYHYISDADTNIKAKQNNRSKTETALPPLKKQD